MDLSKRKILRIRFSRLDENMVEIHVDTLAGFEQPHLHVEFHQKVIEPWVGVESEKPCLRNKFLRKE